MKEFILNRKGQKISVLVEEEKPRLKGVEPPRRLAFVMHGLGAFKEQPHLAVCAQVLWENGYSVVRFDAANSHGESDGRYEDATATGYYEDLEDVIRWASAQSWYVEPFVLLGHSLGGMCAGYYAVRHPGQIKGLAPLATAVSGALSLGRQSPDSQEQWKRTGWRERASDILPGVINRLPWSHMEDKLRYDLSAEAHAFTMPVLMVVGSEDIYTPEDHQRALFDKLPGPKEFHLIEGAGHNYRGHFEELMQCLDAWIKKLDEAGV